jgi:flagellar basal-body rod protein FlgB
MASMLGEGTAIARLALDAAMLRHQAIAANIANVNTPDYVPLRVNFEAQLTALSREQGDDAAKLQRVTPFVEQAHANNELTPQAALDMEIVKLNMNTLHYQALARMVSKYLSIANTALTEGRR